MGIAAYVGVSILEAVETDRHRAQPRRHQRRQTLCGQRKAVGYHAPHISAARDLAAGAFQIVAHQHLAAREYQQNVARIDMGRDLLIEHTQKVVQRHIRLNDIRAAVAAAVAAGKVASERTLPKERRQLVTLHRLLV